MVFNLSIDIPDDLAGLDHSSDRAEYIGKYLLRVGRDILNFPSLNVNDVGGGYGLDRSSGIHGDNWECRRKSSIQLFDKDLKEIQKALTVAFGEAVGEQQYVWTSDQWMAAAAKWEKLVDRIDLHLRPKRRSKLKLDWGDLAK